VSTGEGLDLCHAIVEKGAIFRILLRALEHDPGAGVLDPPDRLIDGQVGRRRFIPSLIDAYIAGIVVKLPAWFAGKPLRQFDQPRNLKKRVAGEMVSEFK